MAVVSNNSHEAIGHTMPTIAIQPCGHHMMTRRKSMISTVHAVLDTYELLENILLQCTQAQIITLRRVNKAWKQIITISRPIQVKLFLAAEIIPKQLCGTWVFDCQTEIWMPLANIAPEVKSDRSWDVRQRRVRPCILNPHVFTSAAISPRKREPVKQRAQICESVFFRLRPDIVRLATPRSDGPHSGSLIGDMFVCQPPVPQVEVYFRYQEVPTGPIAGGKLLHFAKAKRMKVVSTEGVRVRDVAQAFITAVGGGLNGCKLSIITGTKIKRKSTLWVVGAVLLDEHEKISAEEAAKERIAKSVG